MSGFARDPDESLEEWIDRASARCHVCEQRFTYDDWCGRHSDLDGEDVHDRCCARCQAVAWTVLDPHHPDGCVTFDELDQALLYAADNWDCSVPVPVLEEHLYLEEAVSGS